MTVISVAIIGAGNVGTILGNALLKAGPDFRVKYGVRNVDKHRKLLDSQPRASISSVHDACTFADVIILAVPGSNDDAGIIAIAKGLGPGAHNKIIIDATNPLTTFPGLEVRWTQGTSGAEVLQNALPDALVYKAFNTVGAEHMASPIINGQKLTMLIAGSEESSKKKKESGDAHHHHESRTIVEKIVSAVGFEPVYVGPIRYARNLEAMAELWIHLGTAAGFTQVSLGRNFHFQVIKEKEG